MARRKTGSAKTGRRGRTLRALGIGALFVGGAALIGVFALRRAGNRGAADHAAPNLSPDLTRTEAQERAPLAFRPDPIAPVSPDEGGSPRLPGIQPAHDASDPIPV